MSSGAGDPNENDAPAGEGLAEREPEDSTAYYNGVELDQASALIIRRSPQAPEPEGRLAELAREIQDTAQRVHHLFFNEREILRKHMENILAIAQTGLVGKTPATEAALHNLKQEQINIARSAGVVQNDYLRQVIVPTAVFGLLTLLLFIAALIAWSFTEGAGLNTLLGLAWGLLGLTIGFPASIVYKSRALTFKRIEQLGNLIAKPPWQYALYSGITFCIAAIVLWFELVIIGIGGHELNEFKTTPAVGLLLGLTCSLGEAAISEALVEPFQAPKLPRR